MLSPPMAISGSSATAKSDSDADNLCVQKAGAVKAGAPDHMSVRAADASVRPLFFERFDLQRRT